MRWGCMARSLHILAIRSLLVISSAVKTDHVIQREGVALRIHWAWVIAAVAFVTLIGAAGFRAVPSVLIDPLHEEFGWSHGTIGSAVSINLVLFGVISPFAAALMDRLGIRRVVACALVLVAAGAGLTVFMTEPWQLLLCWGCSSVSAPARCRCRSSPRSPAAGSSNAEAWSAVC